MDIQYVWIKSYHNIIKQGFAFSDVNLFHYDDVSGHLKIEENYDYVPGIYRQNISSLSAIIGKNGAGKSTLLEFLLHRIGSISNGGFTIFEEGLECIVIIDRMILCHTGLTISNSSQLEDRGFTFRYFAGSIVHSSERREDRALSLSFFPLDHQVVYFSNVFDIRYVDDHPHVVDISTKRLLYADAYESPGFRKSTISNHEDRVHPITAFKSEEFRRQIELVVHSKIDFPFNLPEEVLLVIDYQKDRYFGRTGEWFIDNGLSEIIFMYQRLLENRFLSIGRMVTAIDYKIYFKLQFRLRLLTALALQFPDEIAKVNANALYNYVRNAEIDQSQWPTNGKLWERLRHLCLLLEAVVEEAVIPQHWLSLQEAELEKDFNKLPVVMKGHTADRLVNLLREYSVLVDVYHFLSFYWPGLSSGQNNMLVFYSRFFSVRNLDKIKDAKQLMILIDEGETYFHPEWQRQYLKMVTEFLSDLFRDKQIQLIITSNSPFIASDIPKSKINFLNVDVNGNCLVMDASEIIDETFAANIHDLFANAFFLPETLMGEIARQWIDSIISDLNKLRSGLPDSYSIELMRKRITLIGEPIIRNLLMQRLEEDAQNL